MAVENPTEVILARALWMLVIFLIIGLTAGWIGQTAVAEHSRKLMELEMLAREAAQAAESEEDDPLDEIPVASTVGRPEGAGLRAG
ncbi:MAG: hypothetical protein JXQ73_14930 [Phycisphaerae bacterium]|nr:hypothetical protein [Phycisphaerae bacterium]